ncbi:hypothetical protein [Pseudoflavitalea rhizosphaerae]|uniref:hypothetical protein n=1 Tax=Pseudoflavitalea rhizosphaerae TaxID=1884793 RepID=UPI000F8E3086|nr:hypothetical protein [Pseudoflavitalea rhizosphaerae]
MQLNKIPSKIVAVIIAIGFFSGCKSQEKANWSEAKEWRLYKITDVRSFSISEKEMKKKDFISADSLHYFLQDAAPLKVDDPVWKSFFFTSCQINGKFRKVIISNYGGFFYDAKSKKYYEIKEENKKWVIEYLEDKLFE